MQRYIYEEPQLKYLQLLNFPHISFDSQYRSPILAVAALSGPEKFSAKTE
jgi:hypothetical protein